jgi:hypothetical protein
MSMPQTLRRFLSALSFLTVFSLLVIANLSVGNEVLAHDLPDDDHWNSYGTPDLDIYRHFTDSANSTPSSDAKSDWSDETVFDLYWQNAPFHEIEMYDVDFGANGVCGEGGPSTSVPAGSNGHHITAATATINNGETRCVSKEATFCHEIGHALGFDHTSASADCLDGSSGVGTHLTTDAHNKNANSHSH